MGLRVVIADDSLLVREGVAAVVRERDALEIVDAVGDLPSLLASVERVDPDVVVTDIRMPPTHTTEGLIAAHEIRRTRPSTGVLVLSQYLQDDYVAELLKHGASGLGYLLKERIGDPDELVRALHAVASGGSVLDPVVVEALMNLDRPDVPAALADLTSREREVLAAMAEGLNNAAIAARLYLSERAIEKHISAIFMKLPVADEREVNRRVMAVLTYLRAAKAG